MQQFLRIYFLLLFLCDFMIYLDARKCYICGPKSFEPFRSLKLNNDKSSAVTEMNTDDDLSEMYTRNCDILDKYILNQQKPFMEEFVKECPPNYSGCLTQTDVNQTTRTCEIVAFNDCHPANGVLYCYCSDDLCNEKKVTSVPDKPKINYKTANRYSDEDESDDEDNSEEESSGMGEKFKSFDAKTSGILSDKNVSKKLKLSILAFHMHILVLYWKISLN